VYVLNNNENLKMSKYKYLTVVFEINDSVKFASVANNYKLTSKVYGAEVIGLSVKDEMQRVENLESLLEENGIDYE
jgi:hypothetical protein